MDCIERKIIETIDSHCKEIVEFGRDIWCHAELGYREKGTAGKFAEQMSALGMSVRTNLALTGVKSYLKSGNSPGPTLALMGEMDALPIPTHPDANPLTGAAHCCGHHAQITGLVGAAMALSTPEVREALGGNVVFFAVPSEEYVDIEYKEQLIREGKLTFGGGKAELLSRGELDDLDMIIGSHAFPKESVGLLNPSMNGFVNKIVKYQGRSAHAASEPEKGVNALNAASVMMHAIDAQRETFRDQDSVRIHGFFSEGGKAMNIIAGQVTMEYSIRAKSMEAVRDASMKFDRAVEAGAVALGCAAHIETIPGYWPVIPAAETGVVERAVELAAGEYSVQHISSACHETASSDYGEISHIIPLIQFYTGGLAGEMHSLELSVKDEEMAYLTGAKIYALSAYEYLKNNAENAKKFIEGFRPQMDKETLLSAYKALREEKIFNKRSSAI